VFASCWSSKGGSGTTVVAASLAVLLARGDGEGVLLVDLAGDLPAALGLAEPTSLGLTDWLAAGAEVPVDGLSRLEVPAGPGLDLLVRGSGRLEPLGRVEVLAGLLADERRSVVVDCGVPHWSDSGVGDAAAVLAGAAVDSLLVTRGCYLSLRRLVACPLRPSGVVLVSEPGRALGRREVQDVVGVGVVAEVPVDASVARAVDSGLLAGRLPRGLERALGRAR
jgi:CobQ/CobB/MinD/ParA nucleotide binding domain